MISDMSAIIDSYSSSFVKTTYAKFEIGGLTYNDGIAVPSTVNGVMTPISSADRIELSGLGHSLLGKVAFYVPGTETVLTENDVVTDSTGIEWVIVPETLSDWREHGNYIKYVLSRRVL